MTQHFAIIGGGIVGSTAAYYLSRQGYKVTLFDEGIGQASQAAAGIICPWFSKRRNQTWYQLVRQGAEFYRLLNQDLLADGCSKVSLFQEVGSLLLRPNQTSLDQDLLFAQERRQLAPAIGQVKTLTPDQVKQSFPLIETNLGATWVQGGGLVDGAALVASLQQTSQSHGCQIIRSRAQLIRQADNRLSIRWDFPQKEQAFDQILLAAGAWLPQILEPLGYKVDIRPQKGQLVRFYHDQWANQAWPVIIPPGPIDLIPFASGHLIVGASHENDQGYDLKPNDDVLQDLIAQACYWLPQLKQADICDVKVGIRAYTSDYGVLVGSVPELTNVTAISGLGSSGLTSGPYLGYQWTQLVTKGQWDIDPQLYPIETYIKRT
ncbi:NAD(P)/FAD-dependent oxidoreductase [Vaginisenegalia massiliensis]|uniref:NAD(P)/FAD-dependent oxidoreductase n=1 Tax=Vaginisenegalia massiliensis TaxID=2058294 RepID=UPI000F5415BE|nr:FAD-dependent oxidoreductase [Vaginisenegalia massiliensis]